MLNDKLVSVSLVRLEKKGINQQTLCPTILILDPNLESNLGPYIIIFILEMVLEITELLTLTPMPKVCLFLLFLMV